MTPVSREPRAILLRRLHALAGVVPLGLFFVSHLLLNAMALQGSPGRDGTLGRIQAWPGLVGLELLGVHLPLLAHVGLGVVAMKRRPTWLPLDRSPGKWTPAFEQVAGLVALAFVSYHLLVLRIPLGLGRLDPTDVRPLLMVTLSSTTAGGVPLYAAGHLVGLSAAAYHLSSGLAAFSTAWGIPVAEQAPTARRAAAFLTGLALFTLGALLVLHYATGSSYGLQGRP